MVADDQDMTDESFPIQVIFRNGEDFLTGETDWIEEVEKTGERPR